MMEDIMSESMLMQERASKRLAPVLRSNLHRLTLRMDAMRNLDLKACTDMMEKPSMKAIMMTSS